MVYTTTPPLAVVALEPGVDGLRTAAARAVRACRGGGTVAWALDASLPLPLEDQVRALAEGAVIGGYDGRRWRSGEQPRGVERFVICGGGEQLAPVAERAALVARWINVARELVDAPPNVISPAGLAERAAALPRVTTEAIDPAEARARRARRGRREQPDRAAAASCSATSRPALRRRRGWRSSGRP